MRNVVNNNFSYVTVEFAYSAGDGYVIAYTGRENEKLWLNPLQIKGCKSRDEAELKALNFLINGDPMKDTYAQRGLRSYEGFTRNARVQLIGFSAFEKGIYSKHNANSELWKAVLGYFTTGKDGKRFDLIRINDAFSKAIYHAETYKWTAVNRDEHAKYFKSLVSNAVKTAKAERAAVAKAETGAIAKADSALAAKCEAAHKAAAVKEVA